MWSIMVALPSLLVIAFLAPCPLCRRARLHQLVDHRIHQRLERGVDDVGGHPDRSPAVAVLVLALDQGARDRAGAAVEDTDAIVYQRQAFDIFLVLAEILAQSDVECVDGTVAFG